MAPISIRQFSFRLRCKLCPSSFLTSRSKPTLFYSSSSSSHQNQSTVIQKCHNIKQLCQIQAHFITSNLFQIPFLSSKLLKQSLDLGYTDYTILIFRHIYFPDTVCVNTVIKAYSNSPNPKQAVIIYFQMLRNGLKPNSFTFPPLISSCTKSESIELGQKCHGQVMKNGVDCVLPVHNCLIHMYGCLGVIEVARKLFDEMDVKDLVSWNSILDGYARFGDLDVAHKLFDEMSERNVVSWNVMIGGYLRGGNPGCGLKLFREMTAKGLRGSDTTTVLVLAACTKSARFKEGRSLHANIVKLFDKSTLILDTALIDMYSKCGQVDVACGVFDRMLDRNLVSWNAMILGHCIHGDPKDGLCLFEQMVNGNEANFTEITKRYEGQGGIHPDEITMVGVLCGCARAGLITEGRKYFGQMVHAFNIKPNFAHYWCMANLFASVGLIQEAEDALRIMPQIAEDLSSQSLACAGLLATCRFQGDVTLGERIGHYLIELQPQNLLCYALLLNIYAAADRWEDVTRIKETMKAKRVGKMPGLGLVDLKQIVHNFKVGDKFSHGIDELIVMFGGVVQS